MLMKAVLSLLSGIGGLGLYSFLGTETDIPHMWVAFLAAGIAAGLALAFAAGNHLGRKFSDSTEEEYTIVGLDDHFRKDKVYVTHLDPRGELVDLVLHQRDIEYRHDVDVNSTHAGCVHIMKWTLRYPWMRFFIAAPDTEYVIHLRPSFKNA